MTNDLTPQQQQSATRASVLADQAQLAEFLEAFVVRDGHAFRWEVRRFGALVLAQSSETFRSVPEARRAGRAALSAILRKPANP